MQEMVLYSLGDQNRHHNFTFTGFGREEGLQYVKGKPQNIYTKVSTTVFCVMALITRLYIWDVMKHALCGKWCYSLGDKNRHHNFYIHRLWEGGRVAICEGKASKYLYKSIQSSFRCHEIFLIFCNHYLDNPAVPVM
jgi:hypothetical protein